MINPNLIDTLASRTETIKPLRADVLAKIRAARRAVGGSSVNLDTIEREANRFYDALEGISSQFKTLLQDTDLSDTGKTNRARSSIAALHEQYRQASAVILETVADIQRRHRDDIVPQAPSQYDPMLARHDAELLLNGVTPSAVPLRIAEIVQSQADAGISYLLVSSSWVEKIYLPSRQAGPEIIRQWDNLKSKLLPSVLSDRQREGYTALAQLERIEPTLAHSLNYYTAGLNL
jgi:hypothetical protein